MSATERPTHAAMNQFAVQAGELLIGGQPLSRVAARVGQTPFYAYDRGLLQARMWVHLLPHSKDVVKFVHD